MTCLCLGVLKLAYCSTAHCYSIYIFHFKICVDIISDDSWLLGVISRSTDPASFVRGRNMPSDSHKILNEDNHFMSYSMPREHRKFFEVPVTNMGELHLHCDDLSTSETSSRGRMLPEDFLAPRTRSLSPGPKGHTFAVNNVNSREFGFSPRSPVKMMDGLKSPPHPLPLPPGPATCSPLPPSPTAYLPHPLGPTTCLQSESQWKKGKLLGSGTFGQVYLGFNRYWNLSIVWHYCILVLQFCI